MRIRSYSELQLLSDFQERFRYLKLRASIGAATFGFDRWVNQQFYTSAQWRHIRQVVIARDLGCDLGVRGYEIHDRPTIHHLNPMNLSDIVDGDSSILDPEYLVTTTLITHNAIHYGADELIPRQATPRRPGDTKLW